MLLAGIDPGGTTGLCLVEWDGGRDYRVIQSLEYPWTARFAIPDWVVASKPDVVVMEAFHLYAHEAQNQIGSDFPSCQVIGAVEYLLYEYKMLGRLVYQPAFNTKGVKIPKDHEAVIGGSEHRKDAYKHLRYYIGSQLNKRKKK